MTYPQQPYPYQPQPPQPPKKKNTALIVLAAVVGGVFLMCAGCVGIVSLASDDKKDDEPSRATTSAPSTTLAAPVPAAPAEPSGPSIAPEGTAVRDGKFEFQVLNIAQSPTAGSADGNPYMQVNAQGVFVIITMRVTNTGDEPQNYFGQNQKLIDNNGREYSANSEAVWMNTDVMSGLGEINPGNSIEVRMAFDVPAGTSFGTLELHDSMLSGGVQLAVTGRV